MKSVLIIGATSAVATEVAQQLLRESCPIYLVARGSDKCKVVAEVLGSACPAWWTCDFTNYANVSELWNEILSKIETIDTVLIAHGYLGDQLLSESSFKEAQSIIDTNFTSVVNWLVHITESVKEKKIRKIGVITSVAGDRGRPRNYTYGASKGALSIYLEGLRSRLWGEVEIYTFKLGPVDTPMTVSHKKNFSFISKERAAALITRGIRGKRYVCYVPGFWRYVLAAIKVVPESIFQKLGFLSNR